MYLTNVCWFTIAQIIGNMLDPLVIYNTLLIDTLYWRNYAKQLTMSSTIFQPRNKFISQNVGTSYNDVEEFAQTSQIPLLDFTNLHLIKKIGKGGYATVFVATYNGIKIARKDVTQLFGDELNEELKHVFCRESLTDSEFNKRKNQFHICKKSGKYLDYNQYLLLFHLNSVHLNLFIL